MGERNGAEELIDDLLEAQGSGVQGASEYAGKLAMTECHAMTKHPSSQRCLPRDITIVNFQSLAGCPWACSGQS